MWEIDVCEVSSKGMSCHCTAISLVTHNDETGHIHNSKNCSEWWLHDSPTSAISLWSWKGVLTG